MSGLSYGTLLTIALLGGLGWPSATAKAQGGGWFGVDPASDGVYAKPYRYVGTIFTFWRDGSIKRGTGFLVGRSHVLTAGHVLYDIERRESPVLVMFTPGEYYGRAPVGSANAVKWAVAKPFLNGNTYYDYGVIKLNRPLGDRTLGWFLLSDWKNGWNYQAHLAGYSEFWNQGRSMLRAIVQTSTAYRFPALRWITNDIPPLGGTSGSPLFYQDGRQHRVLGIYTGGQEYKLFGVVVYSQPGGVKLTTQVRFELQDWINRNP